MEYRAILEVTLKSGKVITVTEITRLGSEGCLMETLSMLSRGSEEGSADKYFLIFENDYGYKTAVRMSEVASVTPTDFRMV